MQQQKGFTFWSLSFTVGVIVVVALVTMKLFPAYTEFMMVKKAIASISSESGFNDMSRTDIKKAFERATTIDNITSVTPNDLEVGKDASGKNVVTAEYHVVVHMVANVSVLLDFFVSSDPSREAGEGGAVSNADENAAAE